MKVSSSASGTLSMLREYVLLYSWSQVGCPCVSPVDLSPSSYDGHHLPARLPSILACAVHWTSARLVTHIVKATQMIKPRHGTDRRCYTAQPSLSRDGRSKA